MALSGLRLHEDLKAKIIQFKQSDSSFAIQVQVDNEEFVHGKTYENANSLDGNFAAWRQDVEESDMPCYFVTKMNKDRAEDGYTLVFYCPSNAKVKFRMICSSALNSFKRSFGGVFLKDYQVDSAAELNAADYSETLSEVDRKQLMTMDEQEKEEAEIESAKAMGKGNQATNAIMSMNLNIAEDVNGKLESFANKTIDTLVLSWDPDTELIGVANADVSADWKSAIGKLPNNEPRYFLHRYAHTHNGESLSAVVFVYYCPDLSKPRLKMSYSTLKRHVQATVSNGNIQIVKSLEASDMDDLAEQAVLNELYPPVVEQETYSKPTSVKAKGKRRMVSKAKFTPMSS